MGDRPDPAVATQEKLENDAKIAIANASRLVRDALAETMPVAPEQYMTISIPGTVVDTNDIADGGTFVFDAVAEPFPPTQVRQAESRLVDGMMPLANVMLGNTGKSVARSYATALDFLLPKKATVSTQNQIRSPGEASYDAAMKYLTTPNAEGQTPVQVYIEKQTAWTEAQNKWDAGKIEARRKSSLPKAPSQAETEHPKDNVAAVQQFNNWQQEHYRRFKDDVQARFIDWVTTGDKYNVEYNFGVVDVDSIMARIERSKQSMRGATIVDVDGGDELQLVTLTPKDWAQLCRKKVAAFQDRGNFSIDQVIAEIDRLTTLQLTLEALQDAVINKQYPKANPADTTPLKPATPLDTVNVELKTAYANLYTAQGRLNAMKPEDQGLQQAKDAVAAAQTALNQKLDQQAAVADEWVKYNILTSGAAWLPGVIDTVKDQLAKLQTLQTNLAGADKFIIAPITAAKPTGTDGAEGPSNELASLGSELASPLFGITPPQNSPPTPATSSGAGDVWTHISASFSASDQKSTTKTSSWGMSASASFGWGLWSAGGSYSHEQSDTDFKSAMASCDVAVSFSALLVNITRPWLFAELFNDYELDTATDALLSPGAQDLQTLIARQGQDRAATAQLAQYSTFPAFPTSFIIAADVVLEFTGKTQSIERHFHSQSNTASAHFGWGPFSVGGSFHQSSSRSDFHMQTTATGVRISFAAPQIIAWISQILPASPRKPGIEPMVQGATT